MVERYFPHDDTWVFLKNKNLEMINLLNSGKIQPDPRHDTTDDIQADVDEDGEEDNESEKDEYDEPVAENEPHRSRGPSVRTKAYTNLTTFIVPLNSEEHESYNSRSIGIIFYFIKFINFSCLEQIV